MSEVLRFDPQRRTNAAMLADAARLGLIDKTMVTLDATWGKGAWWSGWKPERIIGLDLAPAKARDVRGDFTELPFRSGAFDLVCFDPPYGYRGTSRLAMDEGYGLAESYVSPDDRDALIILGVFEAVRVAARGGVVIVKVQDQTVSGSPRMQSHTATSAAQRIGCRLRSVLEVSGGVRPQRSQRTARNNTSQALVFTTPLRRKKSRRKDNS